MSDLTDLEICEAIAKIEGAVTTDTYKSKDGLLGRVDAYFLMGKGFSFQEPIKWHSYNPLTDEALCFRLMVKYKVELCMLNDIEAEAFHVNGVDLVRVNDENPNRAICLAIIEAHKQ